MRSAFLYKVTIVCLFALAATAQESRSEFSFQGTGFFTRSAAGNGTSYSATTTGGFLFTYRYHLHWGLSAEGAYGYDRDTQNFVSSAVFPIRSNVHQITGALVANLPSLAKARLSPYVLAGAGTLLFAPAGNQSSTLYGVQTQAKWTFVYGGGLSYTIRKRVALRMEYRGFVYGVPTFTVGGLDTKSITHAAQPSVGLAFQF